MQRNNSLNHIGTICVCLLSIVLLLSCAHKSGHKNSIYESSRNINNIEQRNQMDNPERKVKGHTKVRMEKAGGVYLVPIKVNGLDLKFIFDTGASSICLSSAEA